MASSTSALLSGKNTEEWFLSSVNSDGSTVSYNDVNTNKVSSFNVVGDLKISCSLQLGDDFLATSCSAEFCRLSGYAMDQILGQDLQFLRCNLGRKRRKTTTDELQAAVRMKKGYEMKMLCWTKGEPPSPLPPLPYLNSRIKNLIIACY